MDILITGIQTSGNTGITPIGTDCFIRPADKMLFGQDGELE